MQKELDDHIGNDRIPDFNDIPNLPTVRAIIKEVLRWRPVTAGGVPHQLIKDDTYKSYHFAKGTGFHANQWAIHRDPELYPDPENFRPERWLSPQFSTTYREPLTQFPNLQNYTCFGFGRRICPGPERRGSLSQYFDGPHPVGRYDEQEDGHTGKQVAVAVVRLHTWIQRSALPVRLLRHSPISKAGRNGF